MKMCLVFIHMTRACIFASTTIGLQITYFILYYHKTALSQGRICRPSFFSIFFFNIWQNKIWFFFFSKVFKFTWNMWNVLKRMKNHFSDFYFSSFGHFCTQNMINFRWIFSHNSKKKIAIFLYFVFHSIQPIPHLS